MRSLVKTYFPFSILCVFFHKRPPGRVSLLGFVLREALAYLCNPGRPSTHSNPSSAGITACLTMSSFVLFLTTNSNQFRQSPWTSQVAESPLPTNFILCAPNKANVYFSLASQMCHTLLHQPLGPLIPCTFPTSLGALTINYLNSPF